MVINYVNRSYVVGGTRIMTEVTATCQRSIGSHTNFAFCYTYVAIHYTRFDIITGIPKNSAISVNIAFFAVCSTGTSVAVAIIVTVIS
jgi:hypothetical protein